MEVQKLFGLTLVLALLATLSKAVTAPTPLCAYRATTDRWHQEAICEATNGDCYYVSTTGDDSDDGSFEYPFATIQHGIDTMQPGDYLYLGGGVYGEHSISLWGKRGSEDAWFTVKSYPGEWAIVDGGHPEDDSGVNIFRSSSHNLYAPIYWRFEYFEVTGAGPSTEGKTYDDIHSLRGAGFHFWPGYHMVFDHMYIHDNYGGGGPNGGAGIKFQNEGGTAVHDVVITHCHLKNNGWPGSTNGNLANIVFFTDYVSDPAQVNIEEALIRNEISYNLIEGSSIGFKDKNSQMLVRNHVGDDMEAQEWGDEIHHNIFINNPNRGIAVRQDFAQVYNNIIVSSSVGIVVGDPPSTGDREPFYVVVYNNLVINSSSGGGITSYHGLEDSISTYQEEPWHPFWYVWNNIVEDGHDENGRNDINILFDWSEHGVDMDTVHIDHNYFYPRGRDEKVVNVVANANDYSADEYEANGWATNLYANLTDSDDPLHTTDSNYKTRHNHILEGATTIANGGVGSSHPYLEGITLPSYVGPCSDDDCSWVDEVLALKYLGDTAVTDLCVTNAVVGSGTLSGTLTATLRWTAPVNAITYTTRYSDTLIAEDNWASAVTITVPFTASTPGSAESLTAPVAYTGGTTYFALKSQNAEGVWSVLSNNAFWPHFDVHLPLVLRGYSGPSVQAASSSAVAIHSDLGLSAPATTVHSTLINPESDLEYLGAFRLPDEESNGTSWSYGGHGMGYYPGGDPSGPADGHPGSLFGISHPYQNYVSEFSIPAPLISPDKNVDDLPVATTLQPFVDVTAGRQTGGLTGSTLGDIQYYPRQGDQTSDKLYWVMYEYYLPEPEETWHGWCELDFSNLQSQGVWRLDDFPSAATSRYLFDIPETWADAHTPGKYLAAGRYRMVNNGSWGPALYAFGPWNDGNPPPDGSSVDAVQLLEYDSDHALRDFSHSDDWSDGAWLTTGTKSAVIFAGMKAMRTKASGAEYYGEPGIDGCGYKGYHAEPYYGAILFYDPEILAEVTQGTIEPYEVQPYATFNVEDYMFEQGCRRTILGGVTYDRQRGLLYVMEKGVEGIYARKPIVHIFRVTDQAQEPDLVAPTVPENLQTNNVTSGQVNFSWDVSSDNAHLVGYIVHRDGAPVATTVITSYSDDKVNPSATYSYTVVAWDARNNRSAPSAPLVATTLAGPDSRAPIITEVRARDITESSATTSWKTDEPATTYIRYGITYSGDETTIQDPTLTTTHRVELTGLTADADYSYHIASADATGNQHEYPGKSFETAPPGGAANSEPVLNGIGSRRVYEGEAIQFTVRADDKDRDALIYSASGVPPGASFDAVTRQFSWTPGFDQTGTYRVTFTVSDTTQSDSERVTIFVWNNPTLALRGTPADQAIHLTWTVNTTLPLTSAWQINYHSQSGTLYTPINIISPTRAHTLTGLTNYVWYTVTLNGMLASAPFLTDTVTVMPTDIFVYLPLVLRGYGP